MDDEPQFSFDFSDIPDTEQKDTGPKEKKVQSTKTELQEALNLQDDHEWIEWLRSDMVKPWWTELWAHLRTNNGSNPLADPVVLDPYDILHGWKLLLASLCVETDQRWK
jgi:hypothetical protein